MAVLDVINLANQKAQFVGFVVLVTLKARIPHFFQHLDSIYHSLSGFMWMLMMTNEQTNYCETFEQRTRV